MKLNFVIKRERERERERENKLFKIQFDCKK